MSDFLERGVSLYCDLHSAGRIMRMIPVCGYGLHEHHEGDEEMLEVQRAAAVAFGLRSIWSNAHGEDFPAVLKGTSLDGAWLARVPAIYCETTGTGACYEKDIALYSQGIRNLIRHLEIADGPPLEPVAGQRIVEDCKRKDVTESRMHLSIQQVSVISLSFQTRRPAAICRQTTSRPSAGSSRAPSTCTYSGQYLCQLGGFCPPFFDHYGPFFRVLVPVS